MNVMIIPFTHTSDNKNYFLLLTNIFLVIILGKSYLLTPAFYLMALLLIFKAAILMKINFSGYAIKVDKEFIYLNQGLLVNHLKIPIKAINQINVEKKEIHIHNLPEHVKNSTLRNVFKLLKTKRLNIKQVSTKDIIILKQYINFNKGQ